MTDISTRQFIDAIFDLSTISSSERVCLTLRSPDGSWRNYPATDRRLDKFESGAGAWYFGISTFDPPDDRGWFPRDRDHAVACYVIVLDDIGTKVDLDRITVPASYWIETSPGNFQVGYIIDPEDVSCPEGEARVEAYQEGFAEAGLTDPGARGTYRVMRVPGSLHKTGFVARVTEWRPDQVLTLEELADAYDVTPVQKQLRKVEKRALSRVSLDDIDDPVLDWLQDQNRTTGEVGRKFVQVICPWAHEHTSGGDTAGYTPAGYDQPQYDRAFKCLHEHCDGRGKRDFLQWVADRGGPDLVPKFGGWKDAGLDRSTLPDVVQGQNGASRIQLATTTNIRHVMDRMAVTCRLNRMTHQIELHHDAFEGDVELQILDNLLRLGIANDRRAMETISDVGKDNPYHPMEEWLLDMPEWDGEDHIAALASEVTTETELWPLYLRKWLIQGVEAVRGWRREKPRSLPSVLTLAGEQNLGKSYWLAHLVPHVFFRGEAALHLDRASAKDDQLQVLGSALVELAELDSTFSKSEEGALKTFLSRTVDTLRAPYARKAEAWPRCTSFCASVNALDFLLDRTGSRRYWPVKVLRITRTPVVDVRLAWSQANALWEAGESYLLNHDEDRRRAEDAEKFTASSHIQEAFYEYFSDGWLARAPEAAYEPKSLQDIARLIRLDMHDFKSPKYRSELSALAEKHFGAPTRISGVRKARMVPVLPQGGSITDMDAFREGRKNDE